MTNNIKSGARLRDYQYMYMNTILFYVHNGKFAFIAAYLSVTFLSTARVKLLLLSLLLSLSSSEVCLTIVSIDRCGQGCRKTLAQLLRD